MKGWETLFYRNGHLLALTCLLALAAGLSALLSLPRLEDPIITNRNPLVVVPYPGATAERVEAQIIEPLETSLHEIPEIKKVESTARAGTALVAIELQDAVTPKVNSRIFAEIRDKVGEVELPPGAGPLVFDDKRRAIASTLIVGLSWESPQSSPAVLVRGAEELAERLRALPGTDVVRLYGEPREEILVEVDGVAVAAAGLAISDVLESLRQGDAKVPGGVARTALTTVPLEVTGELNSAARIAAVLLREEDGASALRVGDVATVRRTSDDPPASLARVDGRTGVLVAARVSEGVRVDQWSRTAMEVVENFQKEFQGPLRTEVVFAQDFYTSGRLRELSLNLLLSVAIVWGIVFLFMGWRPALIVASSIPLTAGLTLFVVAAGGGALHQISIFGMIVALGILIDNAIVITDEVQQRLSEDGVPPLEAVGGAVRHLAVPLIASTLTTVLSFVPIMLLPGNAGDFVGSIGASVVVALVISLLVALTLIAALAGRYLQAGRHAGGRFGWMKDGASFSWLSRKARQLLNLSVQRPWWALCLSLLFPLAGFGLATTLGSQFFPRTDRDMFEVRLWLPPGSHIQATAQTVEEAEAVMRRFPGIRRVDWSIGESLPPVYYNQLTGQDGAANFAHAAVTATSAAVVEELVPALQESLDSQLPKAQIIVSKFAQGPPAPADVEIRIVGPSLAVLRKLGEQVRQVMAGHPAILQTSASISGGEPKWQVVFHEDSAAAVGLTAVSTAANLSASLDGVVAASLVEGTQSIPIRVRLGGEQRTGIAAVRDLALVSGTNGAPIPVSAVADFDYIPEQSAITRRDGRRINNVHGFCRTGSLPIEVAAEIVAQLDQQGFSLPAGYRLEVGGDAENQDEAVSNLALLLPLIVLITIATLVLAFRSVGVAIILVLAAGLSAGYGFWGTWLWDLPLSFNTIIGLIGLIGLAFNSSIVVLASISASPNAAAGNPRAVAAAVYKTGRHLTSTTLTTMGSFLPILIFVGGQFWPPLAVVLAGGVAGSTFLAWVFTPAAYVVLRSLQPLPKPHTLEAHDPLVASS